MGRMALPVVSEVGQLNVARAARSQPLVGNRMAKPLPAKTESEIKKIKASNDAYYKALSARDMHAMGKVWTCAANNMLIAPPANPRVYVGWSAIKRY